MESHNRPFERLVQRIDPRNKLLRTWGLKGGVSAQVTALEIERSDGQTRKMIVRRHGKADLKQNPHIAADEFKLLQILRSAGLAAPRPYYVDQSGEIFATPCVVIEYIEGRPEFAPSHLPDFILKLATRLSGIHHIDGSTLDLSFLPEQAERVTRKLAERPAKVDDSLDEGRIRATLEAVWPLPRRNKSVLLHGDFWPGNILWEKGEPVAVIDWEDAAVGDPLADLANSRLEILWAFGSDAMRDFTGHYKAMTTVDFTDLPYWDLCAALRPVSKIAEWAEDALRKKRMRDGHRLFITQAFDKLAG